MLKNTAAGERVEKPQTEMNQKPLKDTTERVTMEKEVKKSQNRRNLKVIVVLLSVKMGFKSL